MGKSAGRESALENLWVNFFQKSLAEMYYFQKKLENVKNLRLRRARSKKTSRKPIQKIHLGLKMPPEGRRKFWDQFFDGNFKTFKKTLVLAIITPDPINQCFEVQRFV